MKKIFFVSTITLLLYSCNHLKSGVVIGKKYTPAYCYVTFMHVNDITIPQTNYVSETYYVAIAGYYKGKPDTEDIVCTKEFQASCSIGDSLTNFDK